MNKFLGKFPTGHFDLVHDIVSDYYGTRLATCSSDQNIKVWDLVENEWKCSSEWKAHSGSVLHLTWAHPEFGQILASCSFDRTVKIWEEEGDGKGGKHWVLKSSLMDSRDSVQDVKFAPKHFNLMLVSCSLDGFVRTYTAMDVMNLSLWNFKDMFEGHKGGCTCISWNPSHFDNPMLAVGGGGSEGCVKIYELAEEHHKWNHIATLGSGVGKKSAIHDVAWSPDIGRSFHLIAIASKDHTVRLFEFRKNKETLEHKAKEIASFADHHAEVWKVEWNTTGTVLASSGDDGTIRLWKADFLNNWRCVDVIQGE